MNATERRAKIVCTLGPASSDPEIVLRLVEAGLDVARINFSHGDPASWGAGDWVGAGGAGGDGEAALDSGRPAGSQDSDRRRARRLHPGAARCRRDCGARSWPDGRAVLGRRRADDWLPLCGAGRRSGSGAEGFICATGRSICGWSGIDGGRIETMVRGGGSADSAGRTARAGGGGGAAGADRRRPRQRAFRGGAGAGLTGVVVRVRSADDVMAAHEASAQAGGDLPLIAKIETAPAMASLEAIIPAAGGAMVARGDLGRGSWGGGGASGAAADYRRGGAGVGARDHRHPDAGIDGWSGRVRRGPRSSDVANAVWDGADALMLSAETAVGGRHPVEVVEMMDMIIRRAEANDPGRSAIIDPGAAEGNIARDDFVGGGGGGGASSGRQGGGGVYGDGDQRALDIEGPPAGADAGPGAQRRDSTASGAELGSAPWRCDPPDNTVAMLADVESAAMEALGLSEGTKWS